MKVLISVTRRTQYASIVEMTEEQFKRLQVDLNDHDPRIRRKAEREADKLIDVTDWQNDELASVDGFKELEEDQQKGQA